MAVSPEQVHDVLSQSILADGFPYVLDLERSHDCMVYDSKTDREYLDFFAGFASLALGYSHPALQEADFQKQLLQAALLKPANSDTYSVPMAEFVETFRRLNTPEEFKHLFFIEGGALAVENALKTAIDWKQNLNASRGKAGGGTGIIHFEHAFHGRSGYTMSLTNTYSKVKTEGFPKFDWPRFPSPAIRFPLNQEEEARLDLEESDILGQIEATLQDRGFDMAAIIIESIQGEGGDRHFRPQFFKGLRRLANDYDVLLICDEVQTGMGTTGSLWCVQQLEFVPDIICFGKKTQVCGIMATDRIDQVPNVFNVSSRINSTWGGNLVDMVRSQRISEVIHQDGLIDNARVQGQAILQGLEEMAQSYPISEIRGRGLFVAFTLPNSQKRDGFLKACYDSGLLVLSSGERSIRLRPHMIVSTTDVSQGLECMNQAAKTIL